MTTANHTPPDPSPLHGLARPLLVLAGLALLVAAPFEILSTFDSRPFAEVAAGPVHATAAWLILLGFGTLLLAIPALATHIGPSGRRLGRIPVLLTMIGTTGGVVSQWYIGSVIPWLAESAHPELAGELGGIALYATMGLLVVGVLALGIGGLRSRLLPRPAAILLIVAVAGAIFPFVLVPLTGAALLWSGAAGLRQAAPAGTAVPAAA